MANHDNLTDDYVAGLLAKDAKESSIKYSAVGLEAFTRSSKPPANKPKPNTRFLRNIIKDTDSHNAALLAKEAAESKARLEGLSGNEYREQKASHIGGGDIRKRQLGDIAAILGGRPSKKKRANIERSKDNGSRRVNTSSEDEAPVKPTDSEGSGSRPRREEIKKFNIRGHIEENDKRSHHQKVQRRAINATEDREKVDRRRRHRSCSEDRDKRSSHRRHRSRSRSPKEHRSKDSRRRERSPRGKRSPELDREPAHKSHRHHSTQSTTYHTSNGAKKPASKEEAKLDYDSDPLDDIIGPRPPAVEEVKTRGRGAISFGSGIDSRFAAGYDPTADVQMDPDEENDWDQALEALRDRQKWQRQGADRLRAAGFTEDEIMKWEKGGEKREEDVKWSKHGEGREWDRGKVVGDDGVVNVEPSWGRLKDN